MREGQVLSFGYGDLGWVGGSGVEEEELCVLYSILGTRRCSREIKIEIFALVGNSLMVFSVSSADRNDMDAIHLEFFYI